MQWLALTDDNPLSNLWDASRVFAPVRFHCPARKCFQRNQGKIEFCLTPRSLYLPLSFHQRFWFPQRKLLRRLFVCVLLSIEPQQQFPVETKSSFGWFHGSPRSHRSACGQFTTFLGKLKDLPGTVPSLLLASSLFSRYHMSLCYPESISNVLPLPTPALANPPWNLFSWKLKVISSTLFPAISCSIYFFLK